MWFCACPIKIKIAYKILEQLVIQQIYKLAIFIITHNHVGH